MATKKRVDGFGFKVGDTVVGKKSATEIYGITKEGWEGKVIRLIDDDRFEARGPGSAGKPSTFPLNAKHFELKGSTKNSSNEEFEVGDTVSFQGEEFYLGVLNTEDDIAYVWSEHSGFDGAQDYDVNSISKGFKFSYGVFEGVKALTLVKKGVGNTKKVVSKTKKVSIDYKQLDRLILADAVKQEIVSVLDQASHHDTLFTKWGLGDVIEYGRGMNFLFHGGPGTGKTYAAHCMAKALGKELLSIGTAEIQSSEPGAAQRNIIAAFKEAKTKDKVLFIDECDSLITDRAELGMVLASEVNTLLTEIEKFKGVCILATNRIETLDPALERRLSLIIEFPAPDFEARKSIWKLMLPPKLPLHADVKIDTLAEHPLTGGQIKNVVLNAARMTLTDKKKAIEPDHFDRAIKRVLKGTSLMGRRRVQHQRGDGTHIGHSHGNHDHKMLEQVNEGVTSFMDKMMAPKEEEIKADDVSEK